MEITIGKNKFQLAWCLLFSMVITIKTTISTRMMSSFFQWWSPLKEAISTSMVYSFYNGGHHNKKRNQFQLGWCLLFKMVITITTTNFNSHDVFLFWMVITIKKQSQLAWCLLFLMVITIGKPIPTRMVSNFKGDHQWKKKQFQLAWCHIF